MTFGNYDFRYVNNTNFLNGVQYRMGATNESSQEVASSNVNSVNDDSIPENVKKLNEILSRIDSSDKKVSEEDYNEITTLLFEMGFECDSRDDFDNNSIPEKNHYMLYKNDYEKKLCFTYNNGTDDVTALIRCIMTEDEESNTEESSSVTISQIIAKIQDMLAGSKSDISTESILDLLEKNSCTNCNVREDSYTSDESGDDLTYIKLSFELAGMKYNVDLPQDIKIYDTSTFINREFTTEELNNEFKGEPVTVSVNSDKLSEIFDTVVSQDGEPIFYALNKDSLDKLKNAGFSDEEINNMSIESLLVKLDAVKIEKTPIASLVENIQTQLNQGTGSSTEITQILRDNNCKNYNINSERDEDGNINKFKATFTLYGKSYEIELNKDLNTYSSDTLSSLSKDNLDKYFAESVKKDGKAIMYSLNENAINKLKEAGLSANSKISEILAVLNEEEGKEVEDVEDVENVENDTSSESVKSENINEIINKLQKMLNDGASYEDLMKKSPVKGKKYSNAAPIKEGNTLVGLKIDALQLTLPNGAIYNIELRRGNESFGVNEIESTTVNQGKEDEYTIGKEELINKYFSVSVTKDGTGVIYYLNADGKAKLQEAKVSENDSMDKILQTLASGLTAEDVKILNFCSGNHSEDPIGDLEELTKTEGITYTISNVSGDDVTIKITNKNSGYSQDWTIRMTAENKSQISDIYIESVKNTLQKMLNDGASYDALMKNSPVKGKEYSNAVPIKEGNTLVGVKIDALKMFTGGPSYSLVLTKGAVYINSSDIENTEFKDENGQEIDKDIIISRYFDTAITDNDGNIKTYSLNNDALALLQSGTNNSIDEIFSVLNNNISSVDKNIITLCNQLEDGSAAIADLKELVENTATDLGEEKVSFSLEFIGNNKCKITITNKESGYSKSVSIDVTEDNATALKNLYLQKFVDNLQEVLDDDNSNYEKVIRSSSVKNKKYGSAEPLNGSDGNFAGVKFTDLNINGDLYTIELKKGQTTYLAEDIAAVADKAPRIFDYFDAVGTVKNSQGESENKFYVLNDKGKHLLGEPIPTSISEIVNTIAEKLSKAENAVDEFLSDGTRNNYIDDHGNLITDKIRNYLGEVGIINPTIDEVDKTITYLTDDVRTYTVDMGHFDNNYVIYANSLPSNIEANLLTKYFTTIASVTEVDGKETPLYYALNRSNIDANFIASLKKLYTATDLNADEIKNLCAILTNYDQAMSAYNEFIESHTKDSDDFRGHTPDENIYLDNLKKAAIKIVISADGEQNTQFKADDVKTALETKWKNIVNEYLVNEFKENIKKPEGYNGNGVLVLEENQTVKDWLEDFITNTNGEAEGDKVIDDIRSYLKTEFGAFFNAVNFDTLLSSAYNTAAKDYAGAKADYDKAIEEGKTPETVPTAKFVFDTFCKALYNTADSMTQTQFKKFKNKIDTSEIKNVKFTNVADIQTAISNVLSKTNVLNKTAPSKLYSSVQTALGDIFGDIDISKVIITVTEGENTVQKTILDYVYNEAVDYVKATLKDKGTSLTIEEVIDTFAAKLYETGISQKQKLDNTYGVLLPMYAWLQTGFPSNGSEFLSNEDQTKNLGSQSQISWCTSEQVESAISGTGELKPLFENIIDYIEKWFADNGKQADYDIMFNNGQLAKLVTYVMKQTFTLSNGKSPYGISIEDGDKCYLGGFAQGFLKCFIDKMSNPDTELKAIITDININAGKLHSCHNSYTEVELTSIISDVINSLAENKKPSSSADTYKNALILDNRYFTSDPGTNKYTMKDNLAEEYVIIEEFIKAYLDIDEHYKNNYLNKDLESVLDELTIDNSQQITKLELNDDGTIKDVENNAIWNNIKTNLTDVIYNNYPVLAKYIERTSAIYDKSMENLVFNIWNEVVGVIEQDSTKKFAYEFKNKFRTVLGGGLTEIGNYTTEKTVSTTPDDDPDDGEVKYSKEYWKTNCNLNDIDMSVLFNKTGELYTFDKTIIGGGAPSTAPVENQIESLNNIMKLIFEGHFALKKDVLVVSDNPEQHTYGFTQEQLNRYFKINTNGTYLIKTEALKDLPDLAKTSLGALKAYLDTVETDKFSGHAEDIAALAGSVDSFTISGPFQDGKTTNNNNEEVAVYASKFKYEIKSTDDKEMFTFIGFTTIEPGIKSFVTEFRNLLSTNNLLDLFKNDYGEHSVNKFILYMWNSTIGESVFMTYDQLVDKMKKNLKDILSKPQDLFEVLRNLDAKINESSAEADVKVGMTADEIKTKYHLNDKDIEVLFNEIPDSDPKKYQVKKRDGIFDRIYIYDNIKNVEEYKNPYIPGFTGEETFAEALGKIIQNNKVHSNILNAYGFSDDQKATAFIVHLDGWYEVKPEFQQYNSLGAILEAITNGTAPSVPVSQYDKLSSHASDLAALKGEIENNDKFIDSQPYASGVNIVSIQISDDGTYTNNNTQECQSDFNKAVSKMVLLLQSRNLLHLFGGEPGVKKFMVTVWNDACGDNRIANNATTFFTQKAFQNKVASYFDNPELLTNKLLSLGIGHSDTMTDLIQTIDSIVASKDFYNLLNVKTDETKIFITKSNIDGSYIISVSTEKDGVKETKTWLIEKSNSGNMQQFLEEHPEFVRIGIGTKTPDSDPVIITLPDDRGRTQQPDVEEVVRD